MKTLAVVIALVLMMTAWSPLAIQVVSAQSAPWMLLQSPDGTLWIVADGTRHRATPLVVDDATVAIYPEAAPWIGQLGAAAPEHVAVAATPAPLAYDAAVECARLSADISATSFMGGRAAQEFQDLCLQLAAQYGARGVQCLEVAFRTGERQHLSGAATMQLLRQCLEA
jgi:hypothetical protein